MGLISSGIVHLKHKRAVFGVDLSAIEGGAIVSKAPIFALQPPTLVERVEVVLPSEIEASCLGVEGFNFDVVISGEPRHPRIVEIVAPSCERGRPKVHHEVAGLVQEVHVCSALSPADLIAVDEPRDVVRCPFNHVLVPVGAWLEVSDVGLVLLLPFPDDVCGERVGGDRGHKLYINLVPALLSPVWTVPVGEERSNSAFLISSLNSYRESSVSKGLVRFHFATSVVGGDRRSQESKSCFVHTIYHNF